MKQMLANRLHPTKICNIIILLPQFTNIRLFSRCSWERDNNSVTAGTFITSLSTVKVSIGKLKESSLLIIVLIFSWLVFSCTLYKRDHLRAELATKYCLINTQAAGWQHFGQYWWY